MARYWVLLCMTLLLATGVFGADWLQEIDGWYNQGESATVKGVNFSVSMASGDAPERVIVKAEGRRYIIRLGECDIHKETTRFCYMNNRFNPDKGEGSIDYAKDRVYAQVNVISYYREFDSTSGLSVDRTVSHVEPRLGQESTVTITIKNENSDKGFYGLSFVDLVPPGAKIADISSSWENSILVWDGNLIPDAQVVLSYTISLSEEKNVTIKGTLSSEEVKIVDEIELSPGAAQLVQYSTQENITTAFGAEQNIQWDITNLISDPVEMKLQYTIPKTLGHLSSSGRFDAYTLAGDSKYFYEKKMASQEQLNLSALIDVKDHGEHIIPFSITARNLAQEETYTGTIQLSVPFIPLSIKVESTPDFFSPGEKVPVLVYLKNRDASVIFEDVAIDVFTDVDEVDGTQLGAMDLVLPLSEKPIVNASFLLLEDRQYSYTINISYLKAGDRYSAQKTVSFYPQPENTPRKTSALTPEQRSSQEEGTGQEGGSTQGTQSTNGESSGNGEEIVEDSFFQEGFSITSLFLTSLVIVMVTLAGVIWFLHREKKE